MTPQSTLRPPPHARRKAARPPKVHARNFLAYQAVFASCASPASPEGIRKNGLFSKKPHRGVPVDGNGNTRALVKADAVNPAASGITARYAYDGFGKEVAVSGGDAGINSFRFSTKQLDAETGMNYYGYRFYAADTGRWINRDPIAERGGMNVYSMVGNSLVNLMDYTGLCSCDSAAAIDAWRAGYEKELQKPTTENSSTESSLPFTDYEKWAYTWTNVVVTTDGVSTSGCNHGQCSVKFKVYAKRAGFRQLYITDNTMANDAARVALLVSIAALKTQIAGVPAANVAELTRLNALLALLQSQLGDASKDPAPRPEGNPVPVPSQTVNDGTEMEIPAVCKP